MEIKNAVYVSEFLKRDNNNLDLFRIIASCMVIVGHSYVLFPVAGSQDIIKTWTGFTYSGALAVKIFFFISGLVVTNSLLQKKSAKTFVVSRVFRIFPALLFLLVISALVIGPFMSSFTFHQYFDAPGTYNYIKQNLILKTNYNLPRVFDDVPYAGAVNGSLWTLFYEVACYLFLLGVYLVGVFSKRIISNLVFLAIILDTFLPQPVLLNWMGDKTELLYLPASFSIGVLLAINAEKLILSINQLIGFSVLTYLLWDTRFAELLFCFSSFAFVMYVSSLPALIKIKPKYDFSYGIYLWGFFVQQCVAHLIPGSNLYLKMIISLMVSIILGAVSWFLVESWAIEAGKKVLRKLRSKNTEQGEPVVSDLKSSDV
jgi:peptidoglycan/LPS O-acetylase OafA/YrhL